MGTPISSVQNVPAVSPAEPLRAPAVAARPGEFQSVLANALSSIEGAHQHANQAVDRFLNGEGAELHSVILAVQRAELQLELGLQVRNKVVQAYQEIMRMQM